MEAILALLPSGVTAILLGAGAVVLAVWRAFRAGQRSEHRKVVEKRLRALQDGQEIDRAINTTDPGHLRNELKQWGRK